MKGSRLAVTVLSCLGVVAITSCGGAVDGIEMAAGFEVEVAVVGLSGPTQLALSPEGRLLVAQLNGGENESVGQILSIDLDDPSDRVVLFDGLDKPTGVAVLAGDVWVMERRTLSRGETTGGDLDIVLDQLPFNGRSEGTLTPTPDGRLLYDTSGAMAGKVVVPGSGALWSIGESGDPRLVATGFKHAYAHTFGVDGTLWTTEISDGSFDGTPASDEVVRVRPGADHGWPRCVGNNRPVADHGGTADTCDDVPASHLVFDPGATPTSVVISPWKPDQLVVALWNRGVVVTAPLDGGAPVTTEVLMAGVAHPQHLLVVGDVLFVADFDGGRVLAVRR